MDVTSGREWRKTREEGLEFLLPTGRVARLRPVPLLSLIRSGDVPDYLTPIAMASVLGGESPLQDIMDGEDPASMDQEKALEALTFMEFLCQQSMVSPRLILNPESGYELADDEILEEHLAFEDRGFIVGIALQPAELLERFRTRQAANVEHVEHSDDDEDKAK